jgi:hypothetical protein
MTNYHKKYMKYSTNISDKYYQKYLKYKQKYIQLRGGLLPEVQKAIAKLKELNIKIVDLETIKEDGNLFIKINLGKEEELNDNAILITDQIKAVCNHFGINYKMTKS